eukprot:FR738367.1.p1 GENE.FR738367.1~~FR738367.1.p1  ORF type:complete len:333 (+),score=38.20 FR738367.1:107-1000(+)
MTSKQKLLAPSVEGSILKSNDDGSCNIRFQEFSNVGRLSTWIEEGVPEELVHRDPSLLGRGQDVHAVPFNDPRHGRQDPNDHFFGCPSREKRDKTRRGVVIDGLTITFDIVDNHIEVSVSAFKLLHKDSRTKDSGKGGPASIVWKQASQLQGWKQEPRGMIRMRTGTPWSDRAFQYVLARVIQMEFEHDQSRSAASRKFSSISKRTWYPESIMWFKMNADPLASSVKKQSMERVARIMMKFKMLGMRARKRVEARRRARIIFVEEVMANAQSDIARRAFERAIIEVRKGKKSKKGIS